MPSSRGRTRAAATRAAAPPSAPPRRATGTPRPAPRIWLSARCRSRTRIRARLAVREQLAVPGIDPQAVAADPLPAARVRRRRRASRRRAPPAGAESPGACRCTSRGRSASSCCSCTTRACAADSRGAPVTRSVARPLLHAFDLPLDHREPVLLAAQRVRVDSSCCRMPATMLRLRLRLLRQAPHVGLLRLAQPRLELVEPRSCSPRAACR